MPVSLDRCGTLQLSQFSEHQARMTEQTPVCILSSAFLLSLGAFQLSSVMATVPDSRRIWFRIRYFEALSIGGPSAHSSSETLKREQNGISRDFRRATLRKRRGTLQLKGGEQQGCVLSSLRAACEQPPASGLQVACAPRTPCRTPIFGILKPRRVRARTGVDRRR